jgi:hypothetical protein
MFARLMSTDRIVTTGTLAWKPGVQVTRKLGLTPREQQLVELIG